MAQMKRNSSYSKGPLQRVSPLKPGLRKAQVWGAAKVRAAQHSKKSFIRFCGGVLAVFMAVTALALWMGGFWPQLIENGKLYKQHRLMDMGFVVSRVDVMGEGRLNEQDVLRAVSIRPGDYFFGVDLEAAQRRTESLPWVDRAVVRRLWPNRIVVQLVENQPYALWQNEGQFSLVNAAGEIIAPVSNDTVIPKHLSQVVGKGASVEAEALEKTLALWPALRSRTSSAIYVSETRWDLMIDGDVKVKLPVNNLKEALAHLADLQARSRILDRTVSEIDLRLPDRVTVRPTDPQQA